MLTMHGGAYLALKAEEPVAARAAYSPPRAAMALIVLFAIGGIWVAFRHRRILDHQRVVAHDGPSNPILKTVATSAGAWLANYGQQPWTIVAPILVLAARS